ncbi:hypothetical protein Dvina_34565 [Dactylosporangium vinaceum]|uniref:Uncharacterized protein n=1 Tax=Dactylosporangium vinaceum TaxID=53362 RepID=A0ABV5MM74_9ACTN|nr:hypothetical protein [Dactylosporangium vinaceum]UAB93359.1 hypothetical protein Dvina_34565 [Dactylosporangium vinaceum]
MPVDKQVRLVRLTVILAAVLLMTAGALAFGALAHLDSLQLKWASPNQIERVRIDMTNSAWTEAVSGAVVGLIAVLLFRPSAKVRTAVWVVAPFVALMTLCFLVGGPEWAVAPTGEEPPEVRAEYEQIVPAWYAWPHGITALLAAALLVFAAAFLARSDLREYFMDAGYDPNRPYTSWVDRTGGGGGA